MSRVLVLGCGMVGAAMVRDLARDTDLSVLAADASEDALSPLADLPRVETRRADLSSAEAITTLASNADIVIGALPSVLGYRGLRAVIEASKPCCDISFMAENALELDSLACERGVTVVIDCGVAPGLANMIIGHCVSELDEAHDVLYYVGGLPIERRWPYEYKAPFAPSDVIEEYTREARFIVDGAEVTRPALSDPELIEFPGVGALEAFNTDGLRSLLTLKADNIREKTLRWPGHIELMRVLRETGFFSKEPIEIAGAKVRPLDLTSKLLFPHWKLEPNEREFTLLDVRVSGVKAGKAAQYRYYLYDEYDAATGEHSMARTTGYPCTIVARMLLRDDFKRPGVHPPETLGAEPGFLDRIISELGARGVRVERKDA